jgi:DNA-binding NarL/FixJ family response regulator
MLRLNRAKAVELGLSKREIELVLPIAGGVSDKRLAFALGVEQVTVRSQVGSLTKKLGARNRAQLVARAFELGLLRV